MRLQAAQGNEKGRRETEGRKAPFVGRWTDEEGFLLNGSKKKSVRGKKPKRDQFKGERGKKRLPETPNKTLRGP